MRGRGMDRQLVLAAHPEIVVLIFDDGFPRSDGEAIRDAVVKTLIAASVVSQFAERLEPAACPDDPAGIDVYAGRRLVRGMSRRRGNQLERPTPVVRSSYRQSAFRSDVQEATA